MEGKEIGLGRRREHLKERERRREKRGRKRERERGGGKEKIDLIVCNGHSVVAKKRT